MKVYSLENHLSKRVVFLNAIILIMVTILIDIMVTIWLEHEFDEALQAKANVIITLVKDMPDGLDFDFADEFMPEFESAEHTQYFQIWLDDNSVFERSHSLNDSDNLPFVKMKSPGFYFKNIDLPDGRHGRMIQIVFFPQVPEEDNRTPDKLAAQQLITLVLARERSELDLSIKSIQVIAVSATVIILFLINYLVRFTVRKSLEPLHVMKEQIQSLNADNLEQRLSINKPPSELQDVIKQFNHLLERLDESFYREQRFSSDVAHELRTPIAELRSMSEVAIKWSDDVSLAKEFYSGVLESSVQMELLVNNLLALARCEKGNILLEPVEICITEIIAACWNRNQQEVEKRKLHLHCNVSADIKILISTNEFEQIINNLLSNAVSYSVNNSDITIELKKTGDDVKLLITNITAELEQGDLPFIFDRLWRKSKSRSSSEHSGLGLALVRAYAELLGLKISAELSNEKKFTVNIENLHMLECANFVG